VPCMTEDVQFRYVATGSDGKRVRGTVVASHEQAAFERLKRQGLSPSTLSKVAKRRGQGSQASALRDSESAELLLSLSDLLAAGADMRSAFGVLAARAERSRMGQASKRLSDTISSGEALDLAFARVLAPRHGFVSALVGAGEASGDLAGGLRRAGEMLEADIRLRQQLIGALAYPAFVLTSTLAAAGVILLAVVPSLEPLVAEGGSQEASILTGLIVVSRFLRDNVSTLAMGGAFAVVVTILAARMGLLARLSDWLSLAGPWRRISGGILYGGFSMSLGAMLASGAPMTSALRLATRAVRSPLARKRLESVAHDVRQGGALSDALARVAGFPSTIVRLVGVGESTGALGVMLQRGGKLEEDAALRKIQAVSQLLGPVLIVVLGGLIGLMMAGLLSGVGELGATAAQ